MGKFRIPTEDETNQQRERGAEDSIAEEYFQRLERTIDIDSDKDSEHWFLCFVQEITNMEGMPIEIGMRIWPKAAFYAGAYLYDSQLEKDLSAASARSEIGRNAADARHQSLREFKMEVAAVVRREVENGWGLRHHLMAKFLVEEYQVEKRNPFMFLPKRDRNGDRVDAKKVVLDVCKTVLKEMGRLDLISGQRKSALPRG